MSRSSLALRPSASLLLAAALSLSSSLLLVACKQPPATEGGKDSGTPPAEQPASSAAGEGAAAAEGEQAAAAPATALAGEVDRLFAWMPAEPLSVAYDRLRKRFEPDLLAVVFGIPPMAAQLLGEREILDEALDLVFDGEAEPNTWLEPQSFAFTVALSKSPYFLRPLSRPAAELGPLLDGAGFSKNTIGEIDVWLPSGAFPWRIALLGSDVAAFIPVDVPGAGLEPFSREADQPVSAIETELRGALSSDPGIELVLVASGPLIHYDVRQSIAQVQFALRGAGDRYEGQIVLGPSGDVDECANDLRGRAHPEENQQIQALLKEVQFEVTEGMVLGRLELDADRLKHLLQR